MPNESLGKCMTEQEDRIKGSLEAMVTRDIIYDLVIINWGLEHLDLMPSFSLGAVEQQDLILLMNATIKGV